MRGMCMSRWDMHGSDHGIAMSANAQPCKQLQPLFQFIVLTQVRSYFLQEFSVTLLCIHIFESTRIRTCTLHNVPDALYAHSLTWIWSPTCLTCSQTQLPPTFPTSHHVRHELRVCARQWWQPDRLHVESRGIWVSWQALNRSCSHMYTRTILFVKICIIMICADGY